MFTKQTMRRMVLPALRCRLGDRGYFITAMRFQEIAERVKDVAEVHSSKMLRRWIQRQITREPAQTIANYLTNEESRFFNAIVVGVYGGDAQWGPLNVGDPRDELSPDDETRINDTVGVLTLTGKEKLFAIDGQHRVAGIKKAVAEKPELGREEVAVILVGHARTAAGMKRTRRLFVTLNQRAKQVSPRDIVALDEDNGLAVITRQMIDDYPLFQKKGVVSFSGTVSIPDADKKAITSVLGLYQIVKALYPRSGTTWPTLTLVQQARPEAFLRVMYDFYTKYWEALVKVIPEYKVVLKTDEKPASYYREPKRNHLLFRPVGQLAFAHAVKHLLAQGLPLEEAIKLLHSNNKMNLNEKVWHHILWHPGTKTMLKHWGAAEALLLIAAGHKARTTASEIRLRQLQDDTSGS